jgi:hypothetical protein
MHTSPVWQLTVHAPLVVCISCAANTSLQGAEFWMLDTDAKVNAACCWHLFAIYPWLTQTFVVSCWHTAFAC